MSVIPVRRWRTGNASTSRSAADRIVIGTGRAMTQVDEPGPEAAALRPRPAPVEPADAPTGPSG